MEEIVSILRRRRKQRTRLPTARGSTGRSALSAKCPVGDLGHVFRGGGPGKSTFHSVQSVECAAKP